MTWFQDWWALAIPLAPCLAAIWWAAVDARRAFSPKRRLAQDDSVPGSGAQPLRVTGRHRLRVGATRGGRHRGRGN